MTKDEWVLQYGEPCKCSGVRGTYLTSPPICGQCDTRIMEDRDLGITLDTAPATGEDEHRVGQYGCRRSACSYSYIASTPYMWLYARYAHVVRTLCYALSSQSRTYWSCG